MNKSKLKILTATRCYTRQNVPSVPVVLPCVSPTLPISFSVGLCSTQLCRGEGNASGATELSCHAPPGQLSLLISSCWQSWHPFLNPLEEHLEVVWQRTVDIYVSPTSVLRENTTLPVRQESSKTFEIYIFLKEYTESQTWTGVVWKSIFSFVWFIISDKIAYIAVSSK